MDERINKIVTIKTIGWTTFIIFGCITLWLILKIIETFVFNSSVTNMIITQGQSEEVMADMNNTLNQIRLVLLIIGVLTFSIMIASLGLVKLKKWGLILFQSLTIIMAILTICGLIFYVYIKNTLIDHFGEKEFGITETFKIAQNFMIITYGIILLLLSWILTRVNIFLSRKENRKEFQ